MTPPGSLTRAARRRLGWMDVVWRLCRRLRLNRTPLRLAPLSGQTTDQPDAAQAIRWLGPVTLFGRSRDAMFCHPNSRVSFELRVVPSVRIVASCGLLPEVWPKNSGGVEFRIEARPRSGGWERVRSLRLDPARRWRDRRWRTLAVRLPAAAKAASEVIELVLETRVPQGSSGAYAWAAWGDPAVEWPRTSAEIVRSIRTLLRTLRDKGPKATADRLRGLASAEDGSARYARWVATHTPSAENLTQQTAAARRLPYQPLISVVTPVYNTDPHLLRACLESVCRQSYPHWELCVADDASDHEATRVVLQEYAHDPRVRVTHLETNVHIAASTNAALALAMGEFVAFLDHDDELSPEALFQIARCLNEHPAADVTYTDEDKLDTAGIRCDSYFKPDWSPEHFLSTMYTCHLMVVRRRVLQEVDGFRRGYEGAQDYDLLLRLMERTDRIHHLPQILYHWRKLPQSAASVVDAKRWALDAGRRALEDYVQRNGLDAEVLPGLATGLYRVRYRIRGEPLVTIVVPTRGGGVDPKSAGRDLLAASLRSVVSKTSYRNYELVIVSDRGELSPDATAALREVPHRVIQFEPSGSFNFSAKVNRGAREASGVHLVLFNDDLEVIAPDWLNAMLEYSQQEPIGAVGARLLYPDGRLQHIGMLLGVCGVAAHAFHQHPGSSSGYGGSAISVRNYSAVSAACMMTRRAVFESIGGFDEGLAVDFNDVDYCLRVRRAGHRIVFTPYAELHHHEAASFGARAQDPVEIARIRERWGQVLERDPYYNPNLSGDSADYRLPS